MFSGSVKALNNLDKVILQEALFPLLSQVFPKLFILLQKRGNDEEMVLVICEVLTQSYKCMGEALAPYFEQMVHSLVAAFNANKKNSQAFNTITNAMGLLRSQEAVINLIANGGFDTIVELLLKHTGSVSVPNSQDVDTDMLQVLVGFIQKTCEIKAPIFKASKLMPQIIETCC